jgi:hypothetical protein
MKEMERKSCCLFPTHSSQLVSIGGAIIAGRMFRQRRRVYDELRRACSIGRLACLFAAPARTLRIATET